MKHKTLEEAKLNVIWNILWQKAIKGGEIEWQCIYDLNDKLFLKMSDLLSNNYENLKYWLEKYEA